MLFVVEWLAILAAWILLFTQVGIPLWRGTPLFPVVRREAVLRAKLREKAQREIEDGLEQELRTDAGPEDSGAGGGGGAGAGDVA